LIFQTGVHDSDGRNAFFQSITNDPEIRIFLWARAQAFTHWIHPDISGHGIRIVSWPENVTMKFLLPQRLFVLLKVLARGRLFEILHESEQIAPGLHARGQHMEMIWHHAIGVDGELVCDGMFDQNFDYLFCPGAFREDGAPVRTTDCDEIGTLADVVVRVQAYIFVRKRHG
jgi:hypothetical protein